MKLHARMGDKTSAMQQYKICRKYLEAEEAADKSLAINPEETMGIFIKGWLAEDYHWEFKRAEALYDKAIKSQPNNATFLIGRFSIQFWESSGKPWNLLTGQLNRAGFEAWL